MGQWIWLKTTQPKMDLCKTPLIMDKYFIASLVKVGSRKWEHNLEAWFNKLDFKLHSWIIMQKS